MLISLELKPMHGFWTNCFLILPIYKAGVPVCGGGLFFLMWPWANCKSTLLQFEFAHQGSFRLSIWILSTITRCYFLVKCNKITSLADEISTAFWKVVSHIVYLKFLYIFFRNFKKEEKSIKEGEEMPQKQCVRCKMTLFLVTSFQ